MVNMVNNYGGYGVYQGSYTYPQSTNANTSVSASNPKELSEAQIKALKRSGAIECESCKNRKYVDGSNEADVSFKAPGHISPASSGAVVMAHEQQHVSNAHQKEAKGGRVLSATVTLNTAVCPECGRSYTSGGETRTKIAYNEDNPYGKNAKKFDAANIIGANIDVAV